MDTDPLATKRLEIDRIDEQLIELLADRFRVCLKIAGIKRAHGLPVMQPTRVKQVKARRAQRAAEVGLDPEFVRKLWDQLIAEACRLEDES